MGDVEHKANRISTLACPTQRALCFILSFAAEKSMKVLTEIILALPAMLLGWAAIRRAEAMVIWAKRKSPGGER